MRHLLDYDYTMSLWSPSTYKLTTDEDLDNNEVFWLEAYNNFLKWVVVEKVANALKGPYYKIKLV